MFSNPVRQMPYFSNFHGLLFYDHPPLQGTAFFCFLQFLIQMGQINFINAAVKDDAEAIA